MLLKYSCTDMKIYYFLSARRIDSKMYTILKQKLIFLLSFSFSSFLVENKLEYLSSNSDNKSRRNIFKKNINEIYTKRNSGNNSWSNNSVCITKKINNVIMTNNGRESSKNTFSNTRSYYRTNYMQNLLLLESFIFILLFLTNSELLKLNSNVKSKILNNNFVLCVAPPNEYAAKSAWPMAQHDNYAQASTYLHSPKQVSSVDTLFGREVAGPLTVLYTPDGNVVWGSSFKNVFKVHRGGNNMYLIDFKEKDPMLRQNDTFRGIYSILSKEGLFYIQTASVISAYEDEIKGNSTSKIRHVKNFNFSPFAKSHIERISALSLLYDGNIVFITNIGGVGVLTRDLNTLLDMKYLTNITHLPITVSNSISIDEFGGIYAVSSHFMHRLWWDKNNKKLRNIQPQNYFDSVYDIPCNNLNNPANTNHYMNKINSVASNSNNSTNASNYTNFSNYASNNDNNTNANGNNNKLFLDINRRCQVWSSHYAVDIHPIIGRPTKIGSGTTPALIKDDVNNRLYVTIADGQRKQHIVVYDTDTGEEVANSPVNFSIGKDKHLNSDSYTEQSILVAGNKLLVTQNALTPSANRINYFLQRIHAPQFVSSMGLPEVIEQNVYLLPVLLGDSPRGYEQFELNMSVYPPTLRTTWVRNDIGCPNSIPTMSISTGVMYCVGKKNIIGVYPHQGFTGGWTIEALNWQTGKTIFRAKTGSTILYNSLYAAVQIGPDREIIYGALGGLVRLRSQPVPVTSSTLFNPSNSNQISVAPLSNGNERVNTVMSILSNRKGLIGVAGDKMFRGDLLKGVGLIENGEGVKGDFSGDLVTTEEPVEAIISSNVGCSNTSGDDITFNCDGLLTKEFFTNTKKDLIHKLAYEIPFFNRNNSIIYAFKHAQGSLGVLNRVSSIVNDYKLLGYEKNTEASDIKKVLKTNLDSKDVVLSHKSVLNSLANMFGNHSSVLFKENDFEDDSNSLNVFGDSKEEFMKNVITYCNNNDLFFLSSNNGYWNLIGGSEEVRWKGKEKRQEKEGNSSYDAKNPVRDKLLKSTDNSATIYLSPLADYCSLLSTLTEAEGRSINEEYMRNVNATMNNNKVFSKPISLLGRVGVKR